MSLWTPYCHEAALDLSKGAATVKVENCSPHPEPAAAASPERGPQFPLQPTPIYAYAQPYVMEGRQMSRMSPQPIQESTMYGVTYSPPGVLSPSLSPGSDTNSVSPTGRAPPRPFKAVTSSLPIATECSAAVAPEPGYAAFRAAMLEAMRARNGGTLCVSNPRMRRAVRRSSDSPDAEYLQRRARNNAAAKRSRDLRRLKEDELAIRTAYLEQVNQQLRVELDAVRSQLAQYQAVSI
ncbi:Protein giant [Eumeta japonica]|uniref:Protein giant n=1 Tax=Eumeta variegata TaxID=151549 RepID=A0A4C1UDT3_EUMVA|nr:Protein giant [Eumeta japonica]